MRKLKKKTRVQKIVLNPYGFNAMTEEPPTNEQRIRGFIMSTETILNMLTERYSVQTQSSARNRFNWLLPDEFKRWEWTLTSPSNESILLVLELTQLTASTSIPTFTYRKRPIQLTSIGSSVDKMQSAADDGTVAKSADILSKCFEVTPKRTMLRRQHAGSFRQNSFRHTQKASRIGRMRTRLGRLVAPTIPQVDLLDDGQ